MLHVKIAQLDKCRIVPLNCHKYRINFRKCRKLVTSVAKDVQTYCYVDDTKGALITYHMIDLKEEDWFTKVKQLLTPERNSETKVLRGNAPLLQLQKRLRSPIILQGEL
jgi:hypothetical protein